MRAEQLSISKMAALYGLTLRTLRFYEDRGLLQPVRIGTSRFYTAKDRVRIEMILKGKQLGFTLTEIETLIIGSQMDRDAVASEEMDISKRLNSTRIAEQIAFLERKRAQIVSAIDDLRDALTRHERELQSS